MILVKDVNDNTWDSVHLVLKSSGVPSGHIDFTNKTNIQLALDNNKIDYNIARRCYTYLGLSFADQDLKTQEEIINYCGVDEMTSIGWLMQVKQLDQLTATKTYLQTRVKQVRLSGRCYKERTESDEFKAEIVFFLGESGAIAFNYAIEEFRTVLQDIAFLGLGYGDDQLNGIMNYINSTEAYKHNGLKSYPISDLALAVYGDSEVARQILVDYLNNKILNNI